MRYTPSEERLLHEMEQLPTVDAHSHLPVERVRTAEHVDALMFYRQYTRLVMFAAGMPVADFERMHNPGAPLGERFDIFNQWRPAIRHSSAARAARLALQRFYGESELTRDNFDSITERMRLLYQPGVLYRRAIGDVCGIVAVLQNASPAETDTADALLRPVPMIGIGGEWNDYNDLARCLLAGQALARSLDEYVDDRRRRLQRLAAGGAAAFKHFAHPYSEPNVADAREAWKSLAAGNPAHSRSSTANPLQSYLTDELLAAAAELNLPVAVHTGVWEDFREFDPCHLIPYIRRHPSLRFDLFHMGIPYVRTLGRIGANFANVWLNMCWAPTLSPTMAASALDEWIDMVPTTKIIGFGSDVRWPVEKVFGHVTLAREVIATVLGRRIDRGLLGRDDAREMAHQWLYENAVSLYRLKIPSAQASPRAATHPPSTEHGRRACPQLQL